MANYARVYVMVSGARGASPPEQLTFALPDGSPRKAVAARAVDGANTPFVPVETFSVDPWGGTLLLQKGCTYELVFSDVEITDDAISRDLDAVGQGAIGDSSIVFAPMEAEDGSLELADASDARTPSPATAPRGAFTVRTFG